MRILLCQLPNCNMIYKQTMHVMHWVGTKENPRLDNMMRRWQDRYVWCVHGHGLVPPFPFLPCNILWSMCPIIPMPHGSDHPARWHNTLPLDWGGLCRIHSLITTIKAFQLPPRKEQNNMYACDLGVGIRKPKPKTAKSRNWNLVLFSCRIHSATIIYTSIIYIYLTNHGKKA